MIDFKSSIINLHKKFPDRTLDELLGIMDCIVEVPEFKINSYPEVSPIPTNPIFPERNRIMYLTENKNAL